jgi:hypothetical protein
MSERDDRILKEWATTYVEGFGTSLLDERATMRQQNVRYALPRADKLVRELARGRKKHKKTPLFATAAVAACLVVLVSAFVVVSNLSNSIIPQTGLDSALESENGSDPESSLTPEQTAPNKEDASTELMPLDFHLPVQFAVAESKVDNGESIYKLNNGLDDDVVLTMQQPTGQNVWFAAMDKVVIDGASVPAVITDDYKLLQFEDDGTLYTISCRNDMGTLSALYRSIVDPKNKVA